MAAALVHLMLPTRSCFLLATLATLTLGAPVVAPRHAIGQDAALSVPDRDRPALEPAPTGQLARGRYSSRQQATLQMWRQRELSRDEVQRATRDPDPEVAGRANWILRQWRRGALPGIPAEVTRRLSRGDERTAIPQLLEAGQFEAAVVAVEESIGTVDRESVQSRAAAAITRRFPVYIKIALENDALPTLLRLIDLTADSKEMAVCRVELMQQLGLELDHTNLLPTSSDSWTPLQRHQAKVLIHCVLGQTDQALAVAEHSGDARLQGITEMLAGRWEQMARESAERAAAAAPGSYEQARYWSQTLIAADRAALPELFNRAVDELSSMDSSDNQLAIELRWKSLVGHGAIDAGLALLEASRPEDAAVVALAAARGRRAFEILGLPLDQIEQGRNLETWIDEALSTQTNQERPTPEVRSALSMVRCLMNVGRHDIAWTVVTRMADSEVDVDGVPLREYVLATLTMTQRDDWVLRIAQRAGEESFSSITQNTLAGVTDGERAEFATLMDAIGVLRPKLEFADRLRIVFQLLSAQPAAGFESARDFDQLFELLATGRREIQQQRGMAVLTPRVRLSLPIAQLFAAHGRADLAMRCLQYLVATRDSAAMLESAERHLDSGRAQSAAELLQMVWTEIEGDGSLESTAGTAKRRRTGSQGTGRPVDDRPPTRRSTAKRKAVAATASDLVFPLHRHPQQSGDLLERTR